MATVAIELSTWIGESDGLLAGHKIIRGGRGDRDDVDVLIANTGLISEGWIKTAGRLRGIVRPGVGYDNVPLSVCRERGIICAYTPNAPSRAVAELTIGLLITAARGVHKTQYGLWDRIMGRQLDEMILGIVGMGRIGKRVAGLARGLFGEILAFDPLRPDTTFDEMHGVRRVDALCHLIDAADAVTLHVPKYRPDGGSNVDLIDDDMMRRLKPGAVLVNTSRGGIVNEAALLRHLNERSDLTACLDVFAHEPYEGPLAGLCNVIMTCHMGAMTAAARRRMEREAIDATLCILNGVAPKWIIPGSTIAG